MTVHALLFEAESIQAYISDSGRLTDAVGASARVDQLCGDLMDDGPPEGPQDLLTAVLAAAGIPTGSAQVRFSRRGGGAFIALFDHAGARDRVQALWSAALADVAPGLRYGLAATSGERDNTAAEAGIKRMRALRNAPAPVLPEAGPLTRRSPRTGRAAVQQVQKADRLDWVDAQTLVHSGHRQRDGSHLGLAARFSSTLKLWPRDLEGEEERQVLFNKGGHHEIAMVHADGNGLGIALQSLAEHCKSNPDAYLEAYSGFSRAVTYATRLAAQEATARVLAPATQAGKQVPARPLVLGGDDLTILLRPDLAVPFTEVFLLAFEAATQSQLAALCGKYSFLPERLTAAAGIAIVHASHPFDRAMHLAEALCTAVKGRTKRAPEDGPAPSALMFYRQTVSLLDDYSQVLAAETTASNHVTIDGPYLVGAGTDPNLRSLADLRALRDVLDKDVVARGPLRQLITQLHHAPETAQKSWDRVLEMLERRDHKPTLAALVDALQRLGVPAAAGQLPCAPRRDPADKKLYTPLGDALTLAYLEEVKTASRGDLQQQMGEQAR